MEKKWKAVVGVDVSKETLAATVLMEKREVSFDSKNEGKCFEKELRKAVDISNPSEFLVVMENTGVYHLKLACYLKEKGYGVGVENPFVIKKFSEMKMKRAKTDGVDSKIIAEYGSKEEVRLFNPNDKVRADIELKLKAIDDFYKNINILQNQLSALEHRPECSKEIKKFYEKNIKTFRRDIKKLEKEILNLVKTYYSEDYNLLKSIPGAGDRLCCAVISMLRSFEPFEKSKQVTSFLGICPSPYQSGTSVKGSGRILKKGNSYIRKLLYICSLSALRANKSCRELFNRLVQKGKSKRLALIAVANKLIRQAFAVLKTRSLYKEDFLIPKGT